MVDLLRDVASFVSIATFVVTLALMIGYLG